MTQKFKNRINTRAPLTRRDFLKLAGTLPLSVAAPRFLERIDQTGTPHNIIIIVFDAFSAYNMSLYGYQRDTTPNINRLAERAVVYHNHYAGGNFTSPGTASLLTGTLPWKHRAFNFNATVEDSYIDKNLFTAFPNHYRVAYTHNPWANTLLNQFRNGIDDYTKRYELYLKGDILIPSLFEDGDEDIAVLAWSRIINNRTEGYSYSLFLSRLYERYSKKLEMRYAPLEEIFPRGIPAVRSDAYYLLETATNWLINKLADLPQPYLGYFHFFPPHDPYNTRNDFYGRFKNDSLVHIQKPIDILATDKHYREGLAVKKRMLYDEFILYVDEEFGRLFNHLDKTGLSDKTWVVLTSDHGEMFERGVIGHQTFLLFEPVIRIPLMVFEPGRKTREDIHVPTSAVDVLPTLLQVTGQEPASWSDGTILPPYASSYLHENRGVYSVEAKGNAKSKPLQTATISLVKDKYKIIYYFGHGNLEPLNGRTELYNLELDPEELNDLFLSERAIATEMLSELQDKIEEVNTPYY